MYRVAAAFAALVLLLATPPANSHHSFIGKYDGSKLITIKGVIADLDYRNPHIFFSVRTTDGALWRVEAEGISKTSGKGLTKQRLKVGTSVTVRGWPDKKGRAAMGLQSITLPGGKTIKIRGTAR